MPPVILWAWERPENLDFIDTAKVGVAFLAKTISLRAERVVVRPRQQPLRVPETSQLVAVARIETDRLHDATLSDDQANKVAEELSELAQLPSVAAIQIDFDATLSERPFYRDVLFKLRRQVSSSMPISITALASWCRGDNWVSDLPIDEAVPMLFRMGVEHNQIVSQLSSGMRFTAKPCDLSAGISTDEPLNLNYQPQRIYVFSPQSWSPDSVNKALETLRK